MTVNILDLGDAALTLEFGDRIDPALQAEVHALDLAIETACADGRLAGIVETVPTFRSLTVVFDPLRTDRAALIASLRTLIPERGLAPTPVAGRHWRLPACYEGDAAPDLAATATATGLRPEQIVSLHSETDYVVYMLGFLPGFPFMGDVAAPLRLPRRSTPRTRVPAGSVAIATGLTAIYPWESPGGWHLIGRCPVPLFNVRNASPALLRAGDRVCFQPVSPATFASLAEALEHGELDPERWCTQDGPTPPDASR